MTPPIPAPAGEARLQEIRARWTDDPRRFFDATRHAHCDADIAFLLELVGASGAPGRDATGDALQAFAARRDDFHHTYNGGWHHSPDGLRAFHHGMDTVFNALDKAVELGASRGLPAPPGKQHWQWAWGRAAVLENAIRWALGEEGDFAPRPDGAGAYWWRSELRERAFGGLPAAPPEPNNFGLQKEIELAIEALDEAAMFPVDFEAGVRFHECAEGLRAALQASVRARTALGEGRPE